MPLSCRYYAEKFPETEDVVMVKVRSIADMGAYVNLLEYDDIEGMILLSELSRRRIRSINKLIRIGKTEPVVVIRVDKDKGYIDLSKRRVSAEDIDKCTEKFSKAKAVNSILRHVAFMLDYQTNEQLEELYQKTAWLFDKKAKRQSAAYEAFKQAVKDPSLLDECGLDEKTKETLLNQIKQKLTPQAVKIRAYVECSCYGYEGINAVKRALRAGMSVSTEEIPIKINLVASPIFVINTHTQEKEDGMKALTLALKAIEEAAEKEGGTFRIKSAPKVVTKEDEAEHARQMELAEQESRQVAGDDSEEEESEEGSDEEDDEKKENGVKEESEEEE